MLQFSSDTGGLLDRTATALAMAATVPKSPGIMVGDQPMLCAAASLVHHAVAASEPTADLTALARSMVIQGKDFIIQTAKDLDLDTGFVIDLMRTNDSIDDNQRRAKVVAFLRSLVGQKTVRAAS